MKTIRVLILSLIALGVIVAEEKKPHPLPIKKGVLKLSMKQAVDLVLRNNLTLRSSKYDVLMSNSNVMAGQKKFAPVLKVEGSWLDRKSPVNVQNRLGGTSSFQGEIDASISKLFDTGTRVSAGVREGVNDTNDQAFAIGTIVVPATPQFFTSHLYVSVQQELLKNAFGVNHRRNEEIEMNQYKNQRSQIIDQLSVLIVNGLVDYWQVTINTRKVENAKKQLAETKKVRNTIIRNIRLGLSERFDLNNYNSLVARAESQLKLEKQTLIESKRKLLRTINMPSDTKVAGLTDLLVTLPRLNKEEALRSAFIKRVDYQNALRKIDMAELEIKVANNNALPSLTAGVTVTLQGQDTEIFSSHYEIPNLTFPQIQATVKMSYPLWDQDIKAKQRNAYLKKKQAKIEVEDLKQVIRDEVIGRLERVKLNHEILKKNRIVTVEAVKYYNRLLLRSRQGRFNSVSVKSALDSLIDARQKELEALIQFNVSILQFDLAKNEVFERYDVNIEKLLKGVKW